MDKTYWNHQGRFQAEYEKLFELVPASGKCDTVAGEMIRAVSKLGYDFYNNGMGNNTSGAANFLRQQGAIDPDTYATIYEYTRGKLYQGRYNGDGLQMAMERAVDQTVEMILRNPVLMTMANDTDMHDLSDEDEYYEDDDYYDEEEETY